jgi:microcystin-dependent protein
LTDALALDVFGNVIPSGPASAYLRVNAGANGIEARTAEQARGDLDVVNRAGDTMTGALILPGSNPTLANQATRKAYVDAIVAAVILAANPPGKIDAFAMSSPPSGWLFCDGSAVSRTQFSALFDAIGTAHGIGNGATTFNLPDYRGVFLRGFDAGRGLDPGRVFASFQDDALGSHGHQITISDPGHRHWSGVNNGGGGDYYGASEPENQTDNPQNRYSLTAGVQSNTSHLTSTAMSGITATASNTGGAETRPKNVAVYICIKT